MSQWDRRIERLAERHSPPDTWLVITPEDGETSDACLARLGYDPSIHETHIIVVVRYEEAKPADMPHVPQQEEKSDDRHTRNGNGSQPPAHPWGRVGTR